MAQIYILSYLYCCNLAPSELLKINDVFSSVDGNVILSQIPTHADSGSSILSRAISNVHKFQQNQQFLSRMTGISFPTLGLRNFLNISRFCLQSFPPPQLGDYRFSLFPTGGRANIHNTQCITQTCCVWSSSVDKSVYNEGRVYYGVFL